MKVIFSSYDDVQGISKFDIQYIDGDSVFEKYHSFSPDIKGIEKAISVKKATFKSRENLVSILTRQHENIDNPVVLKSINTLKHENTFCVTSAHQPCLFGGPAFIIYKIASTIHLSKRLQNEFPAFNFVPVFYLGSEDHDFDEINHLYLFNKKLTWENNGTGACGRFNTDGLEQIVNQILSFFENQKDIQQQLNSIFQNALKESNYKLCIRSLIYQLFNNDGLIVLDPDDSDFKKIMIPYFEDEILNKRSFQLLLKTIESLESDKIRVQARGREINLFYLNDSIRERIIPTEYGYEIHNKNIRFTTDEIINELKNHPERFSPNVILRPLYQETILPTVAFIGGGGEVAYWTELKEIFTHYGISFPPVLRRNSVTIADRNTIKKIMKTGLDVTDFLQPFEKVESLYIAKNSERIDFSEFKEMTNLKWDEILEKLKHYDNSLTGKLNADRTYFLDKIDEWEKRLYKQQKLKNETALKQLQGIHQKFYPENNLQERFESSIFLIASFGKEFTDFLIENLNPLDKRFMIIMQQD